MRNANLKELKCSGESVNGHNGPSIGEVDDLGPAEAARAALDSIEAGDPERGLASGRRRVEGERRGGGPRAEHSARGDHHALGHDEAAAHRGRRALGRVNGRRRHRQSCTMRHPLVDLLESSIT